MNVLKDINKQGFSRITPFKIGGVENRMKTFAATHNIELGSNEVYMSSAQIAHATRDSKQAKGLTASDKDLASFPSRRTSMNLHYDTKNSSFVYTTAKTNL